MIVVQLTITIYKFEKLYFQTLGILNLHVNGTSCFARANLSLLSNYGEALQTRWYFTNTNLVKYSEVLNPLCLNNPTLI